LFPPNGGGSVGAQYGIQDDAWLLGGPGTVTDRIAALQRVGVRLVRVTLRRDEVAATRPAARARSSAR